MLHGCALDSYVSRFPMIVRERESYFVEVPNLEHGFAIMQRVFEQTISGGERVTLASQDRPIGQHHAPEQPEIVLPDRVANVDGSARDGSGRGVKSGARVSRLEHVPVRVDEVPHPQAVVCAMHHVAALEPEGPVQVPGRISAPEIISCQH